MNAPRDQTTARTHLVLPAGTRRVLNGSTVCKECDGRGEIRIAERHGFDEWTLCPVCHGNSVVPIWKELPNG